MYFLWLFETVHTINRSLSWHMWHSWHAWFIRATVCLAVWELELGFSVCVEESEVVLLVWYDWRGCVSVYEGYGKGKEKRKEGTCGDGEDVGGLTWNRLRWLREDCRDRSLRWRILEEHRLWEWWLEGWMWMVRPLWVMIFGLASEVFIDRIVG